MQPSNPSQNPTTWTLLDTISTPAPSRFLALAPDQRTLYTTGNDLVVIDTASKAVVTTIPLDASVYDGSPRELAVTPDGTRVYQVMGSVHGNGKNGVVVLDTASNEVTASIALPDGLYGNQYGATGIAVKPDGARVYAAIRGRHALEVVDAETNTYLHSISLQNQGGGQYPNPMMAAFTPDGSRAYTVDRGNRTGATHVFVINADDETVAGVIPLSGIGPARNWAFVTITPDGSRAYVAAYDGETPFSNLAVIDTDPASPTFHQQIGLIATSGSHLLNSAVTPDGTQLLLIDVGSNRLLVIDIDPASPTFHTETGAVAVGDSPWEVVTGSLQGSPVAYVSHSVTQAVYMLTPEAAEEPPVDVPPTVFVANQGDYSVTAFSTPGHRRLATVIVGQVPRGLGVTPDNRALYVLNQQGSTDNVQVLDTVTHRVAAQFTVPFQPIAIVFSPDGALAYTSHSSRQVSAIAVIETASNTVRETITLSVPPADLALTPDGAFLYAVNVDARSVTVIETATNTVRTTITGVARPGGMVMTPDGRFLYVTSTDRSDVVTIIETATNTIAGLIENVGISDHDHIDITPDGRFVYIGVQTAVKVIETATNTVVATITAPIGNPDLQPLAVGPDGTRVYVGDSNHRQVFVIDVATHTVVGSSIHVGLNPQGIAVVPHPIGEPPPPPPPVADAGADQTVEVADGSASVTLDGTGSSGTEPLTFTWAGPFAEDPVTGPTPTVTLPLGEHTITLTVEDGNGATDTDTVRITVVAQPHRCPVVLTDDFDDGILDPAWTITFHHADAWDFDESETQPSWLTVRNIIGATSGANLWRRVLLSRPIPAVEDFRVTMRIAWNSDAPPENPTNPIERATQRLMVGIFDGNGEPIVNEAGFLDHWQLRSGSQDFYSPSGRFSSGYNTLPFSGTALVEVDRTGTMLTFSWDGVTLFTTDGSTAYAEKIELGFWTFDPHPNRIGYPWHMGTLSIDQLRVEGCLAAQPPVADPGAPQTVECSAPVRLDGTGSSGVEPLTFTWAGPFAEGSATGPTPAITLPLGEHTITLTVEDGNGSTDTAEVLITVEDTTAPEVTVALLPATPDAAGLWEKARRFVYKLFGIQRGLFTVRCVAADACDASPSVIARILTPVLDDPAVVIKTKQRKRLVFYPARNKVKVYGPDPLDFLAEVQAGGGVAVTDGQALTLNLRKKEGRKVVYRFAQSGDLADVGCAPVILRCTARDASKNEAMREAKLP